MKAVRTALRLLFAQFTTNRNGHGFSRAVNDPAEYLDSPKAIAAYLTEALETGDPALVPRTLGK